MGGKQGITLVMESGDTISITGDDYEEIRHHVEEIMPLDRQEVPEFIEL